MPTRTSLSQCILANHLAEEPQRQVVVMMGQTAWMVYFAVAQRYLDIARCLRSKELKKKYDAWWNWYNETYNLSLDIVED